METVLFVIDKRQNGRIHNRSVFFVKILYIVKLLESNLIL